MAKQQFQITSIVKDLPSIPKESFVYYLIEIFDIIADDKLRGLTKTQFEQLFVNQFPLFIAEKLFESFIQRDDKYMSKRDFVQGFFGWFYASSSRKLRLFMRLLNFHKDCMIYKEDVNLILIHLHYHQSKCSFESLKIIIDEFFQGEDRISSDEFKRRTMEENGDLLAYMCLSFANKSLFCNDILRAYNEKCYPFIERKIHIDPYIKGIESNNQSNEKIKHLSKDFINYINNNFKDQINLLTLYDAYDDENETEDYDDELNALNDFENDINQIKQDSLYQLTSLSTLNTEIRESPTLTLNSQSNNSVPFILQCTILESNIIERLHTNNIERLSNSSFNICRPKRSNRSNSCSICISNFDLQKNLGTSDYIISDYKGDVVFNESKKHPFEIRIIGEVIFFFDKKSSSNYHCALLTGSFVKCSKSITPNGEKIYKAEINSKISKSNKEHIQIFFRHECDLLSFDRITKQKLNIRNVFDDYTIIEEIGKGVFGKIFLCIHKRTKDKVAIKVIRKEISENDDLQMFLWEIDVLKLLMKVSHPNIIQINDLYETEEKYYIVTPYYKNGTLLEYNKAHEYFSYFNTLSIISQTISAISFLNSFGIMHRDIKPSNILISSSKQDNISIKLIDFGFAKVSSVFSTSNEWYGSLGFSAPEINSQTKYSHNIDCWSIGMLCFYLIHATIPLDAHEIERNCLMEAKHLFALHRPDSGLYLKEVNCYDILNKIIISCLKTVVNGRVSIKELQDMLED